MYGTIKAIPECLKFCSFSIKFGYHFGSLGLTTDLRLPTDGGIYGKLSSEGTVIVAETSGSLVALHQRNCDGCRYRDRPFLLLLRRNCLRLEFLST